ncbi:MAG TPA: hypothetical protein VMD03_05585 [Steroidobacteraceae bacterium]|nr:hypothetical protein [Steroidobacteraceae bacterium]
MNACIEIGTFCMLSERRCAVTVISVSPSSLPALEALELDALCAAVAGPVPWLGLASAAEAVPALGLAAALSVAGAANAANDALPKIAATAYETLEFILSTRALNARSIYCAYPDKLYSTKVEPDATTRGAMPERPVAIDTCRRNSMRCLRPIRLNVYSVWHVSSGFRAARAAAAGRE